MIITCEGCNSKFRVDCQEIGLNGRFVRCSKCDHEWLAELPKKEALKADLDSLSPADKPNVLTASSPGFLHEKYRAHSGSSSFLSGHNANYSSTLVDNSNNNLYLSYSSKTDTEKHYRLVAIISGILSILLIGFIVGLEHIEYLERRASSLAKAYNYIGVYGHKEFNLVSFAVEDARNIMQEGSSDEGGSTEIVSILHLVVLNPEKDIKILNKISILAYNRQGHLISDFLVKPNLIFDAQAIQNLKIKLTHSLKEKIHSISLSLNDNRVISKVIINNPSPTQ